MKSKLPCSVIKRHKYHTRAKLAQIEVNADAKLNLVFFTGAGVSVESGLPSFRDRNGLWRDPELLKLTSVDAVKKHPEEFVAFYNRRHAQIMMAKPNGIHYRMAELESDFNVQVITQNVDDLHERAGNQRIVHLHGSLLYLRPLGFDNKKYWTEWLQPLNSRQRCSITHSIMRPAVVLFGEKIHDYYQARRWLCNADIVVVIGTSLQVEPARSLLTFIHPLAKVFYVNPELTPETELPFPGGKRP